MTDKNFWEQDRTTIHQKRSWFGGLSPRRKVCYTLILLFLIAWCFYLGFSAAVALSPKLEGKTVSSADITEPAREDLVTLEGTKVILLVGADNREGESAGRTDTIILAFLDMTNKSVKLLSIPRDTYVMIPGTGTKTKINHSYFYGGINLTMETIEDFLGVDIDGYVQIDFQGFADVIDAIGGVEVDVEMDMYKKWENINLKAGLQTLNGQDALGYVRFRGTASADIGRIERQQKFLKLLAEKLVSLSTIVKIPQLVSIGLDNVTTSLPLQDCVSMATALTSMDLQNLDMYTVPGNGKYIPYGGQYISFWVVSASELKSILQEITGNDAVTPHIIDDGGQGTTAPVKNTEDEDDTEGDSLLGNDASMGAGQGTTTDPATDPAIDPATDPATDSGNTMGTDAPAAPEENTNGGTGGIGDAVMTE